MKSSSLSSLSTPQYECIETDEEQQERSVKQYRTSKRRIGFQIICSVLLLVVALSMTVILVLRLVKSVQQETKNVNVPTTSSPTAFVFDADIATGQHLFPDYSQFPSVTPPVNDDTTADYPFDDEMTVATEKPPTTSPTSIIYDAQGAGIAFYDGTLFPSVSPSSRPTNIIYDAQQSAGGEALSSFNHQGTSFPSASPPPEETKAADETPPS